MANAAVHLNSSSLKRNYLAIEAVPKKNQFPDNIPHSSR